MNAMIRHLGPLFAVILCLASCAPAPQEAARAGLAGCAAADWRAEGLADAAAGRAAAPGLARIAACPALGPPAAREAAEDAYLSGHDEGRAAYCAPDAARALGARGAPATLECPPHMEAAFARAYAAGSAERGAGSGAGAPRILPSIGIAVGSRSGVSVGGGVGVTF